MQSADRAVRMTLTLDRVASSLEALEETIIHKLIDRAQFRANPPAYERGGSGFAGESSRSLFELRLRYTEEMDAQFGRFGVPEERPFTTALPPSRRVANVPDTGLHVRDFACISVAPEVLESYRGLIAAICQPGDDGHYGSSVEHDIFALQAISRRVHFGGVYVAECKYLEDPTGYAALAAARDTTGLLSKLTRQSVEDRIVARVSEKVAQIQHAVNASVRVRIDPDTLVTYYRDTIIPLTKQSEVLYLVNRERGGAA